MTAAGAAGLALAKADKVFAATTAWPATGTMEINPDISNLRVVCCYDTTMFGSTPASYTFDTMNNGANKEKIQTNLDLMAMSLSQKTTADLAWKAIFQLPAGKTWSQVKVAIKINVINSFNQPRVAIVEKVCRVLNGFGVPAANIIVYDGCPAGKNIGGAQTTLWAAKFSATDATKIPGVVSNLNGSLGGTAGAATGVGSRTCTAQIAKGTIDILVNCAVNKGHATYAGGLTLSCKNHFGTFAPDHTGTIMSNILAFNKSDAILGGTPPRQQLCIVDSLFADLNNNPDGQPTQRIDRLVMGTFGPIVDYQTAINIRKAIMITANKGKDLHDWTAVNRFLTDFGYKTTDALQWINISPTPVSFAADSHAQSHYRLEIALAGSHTPSSTHFAIPASNGLVGVGILDLMGREIRAFNNVSISDKLTTLHWDGKSTSGAAAAAGTYIVKVTGRGFEQTGRISVAR
jgi:hypothetical protein